MSKITLELSAEQLGQAIEQLPESERLKLTSKIQETSSRLKVRALLQSVDRRPRIRIDNAGILKEIPWATFIKGTPTIMAFLGGTFFPLNHLPVWGQKILGLLPLTHAAKAIRSASFGSPPEVVHFLVLAACGLLFFLFALFSVSQARE